MNIPKHVAIIPDGNRRWAKGRNLPSFEGHRYAADKTLTALLEKSIELGIRYFTFWALSTENYRKRSKLEIDGLLTLGRNFFKNKLDDLRKNGVRVRFIGNISALPKDIQNILADAIEKTQNCDKITFILALNYGGKDEIVRAVKRIPSGEVTKESISKSLDTADVPDPDLIIRTGGEQRLSGFMLWQSEYSELYFTDILFPDFTPDKLAEAVDDFSQRQRRFGA